MLKIINFGFHYANTPKMVYWVKLSGEIKIFKIIDYGVS